MRIVKDPDERKQEIVAAAIRVFARNGYEKTSISDIAKEINISQGLCYRYFKSKEEIYDAAIEEYADYIVTHNIKRYQLKNKSLKEQIQLMSGRTSDLTEAEKGQMDSYELFHKQENHKLHDQLYLKVGEKLVPIIAKSIKEAKERGETNVSDPEAVASFVVYGQIGILMSREINEDDKMTRIQECLMDLLRLG